MNMNIFLICIIFILPSIIAIGIIDYVVMRRWLRCEYCNHEVNWSQFILPTFIEITLFILGIIIGYNTFRAFG